ncbi:tetratricopeptide repeat protein [Massilia sp. PWRC2]|uniref:tetratricopeptide repeat protein n=1 Tax=Massilia sp. PWRC2 TaxID=2804626 RepID=UPI003CF85021
MSVINTMLQDLDARAGQAPPAPLPAQAAPMLQLGPRPLRQRLLLIALAGALAVATWPASAPSSLPSAAAPPAPPKTIVLAPVSAETAAPPQEPVQAAAPLVSPPAPLTAPALAAAPASAPALALTSATASASASAPAPAAAATAVRPPPAAAANAVAEGSGSVGSPYRRALDHLAGGRKAAAIGELKQALQARPRDMAARETLVGLLLDGGRTSDAVVQLQAALALEPRHPAMAMLLARLQIDAGGDGIDTLLRSLPAVDAGEIGEAGAYHALLAGALQRRGRHHEAVPHYQAALQTAPDHGLWLLGLGLALRADGRSADAIEAFRRANAAGDLTPELAAFVAAQLPAQR